MSHRLLLLGVVLGHWLLSACDDDDEGPQRLPLPEQSLPLLRCAEPVAAAGECARDADCSPQARCVLDPDRPVSDRGPVPLACGAAVGDGEERARCETGADCESGLCALAGVCLSACATDQDCVTGLRCQPIETWVGADALAPVMGCARSLALPADVRLVQADRVEALTTGVVNHLTTEPADGTQLLYLKPDCGAQLEVHSLRERGPERELFDLDRLLMGRGVNPNPVVNFGALVPVLIPNNPALELSGGGFELGVAVDADTGAERVLAAREGTRSTLDLNVYYVGAGQDSVDGGFHPGAAPVKAMFEALDGRYRRFGMQLGIIREYDVRGALRDELSVLEVEVTRDDLGNVTDLVVVGLERLFELSAGNDDAALNLFLIRDMGDVLGVSGGVPGSLGAHGTSTSGVALALDVVGLDDAPTVLMHEMSHQMGLFHTTELDGFVVEPLADTPVCSPGRDIDGNGVLSELECKGFGADNLMFWSGTGGVLSPEQIDVLRQSLVLR